MSSIVDFIAMFDGLFDPVEQSVAFNKQYHAHQVVVVQAQSKKCENIYNMIAYGYEEVAVLEEILHQNVQFLTDIMRGMIVSIVARRIAPGECYICLEDEAEDPMVCLFCLKVIGCQGCYNEYIKQTFNYLVKCPNCQRHSPIEHPFFAYLYKNHINSYLLVNKYQ
ncbi:unnamed protein product [Bursaphelenchus okinawaensis]|uniref:RING-type domain-containing protein n=1 Tax=Bursaphelenchus okinawaensis TaxID=465554 RepID=A0A811JTW8_9BILA|nr:unnamed protein product [Bursaphelenchus okinawaensis]CAG9083593.1 unnamed protein product [Bursaphelenchus okinawaensis]